jgi:hypothetical protein
VKDDHDRDLEERLRTRMADLGAEAVTVTGDDGEPAGTDVAGWVSRPEQSDTVIRQRTGRGWDEWRELIDGWEGHEQGHGAVATWLHEEHGVPGWWAQTVTVGWERITGRRLPHQVADGTFTVGRSATVTIEDETLRGLLLSPEGRAALFPRFETELRSRPTSKTVRLGLPDGVTEFAFAPKGDGRTTVTISHAKLPDHDQVAPWKAYWGAWLDVLEDAVS